VDGVIDYDAESEAAGEKHLWTEKEYGDFTLRLEWRIKETPYTNPNVHIVKPDGLSKLDAAGKPVLMAVPDSDSGIYLRGLDKAQVNIWCWPVGSGEVYGYRTDEKMPASVRAGVTPKKLADRNIGEWNAYEITMKGSRLTGRAQRRARDRERRAAGSPGARPARAAAPREQEGRQVECTARPRAVPATSRSRSSRNCHLSCDRRRRSNGPGAPPRRRPLADANGLGPIGFRPRQQPAVGIDGPVGPRGPRKC
jgi:hypothetical protein